MGSGGADVTYKLDLQLWPLLEAESDVPLPAPSA